MVKNRYKTEFKLYPYVKPSDFGANPPQCHPVVIVGGGPVGMALALDLGRRNIGCVVLDDHDGVGQGSRAICFSKRTLEICDRLGCGDQMVAQGVQWNKGRVFRGDKQIYDFNLLPDEGHERPAFINLQQPYFERFLVDEIRARQAQGAPIQIRGHNRVTGLQTDGTRVTLEIDTPDGRYELCADWVVAADGANSSIRSMMGLDFDGRIFEDNFLIADIRMQADFPVERRFWFDPPFNPGQTALMHKQPDDIWRLDFQLGWDIARDQELSTDKIKGRVRDMIGPGIPFELVWTSIYTFRCCSMDSFRHGSVLFAGDSAHQVSPFGARGANGGIQDADNLGWKLAAVLRGDAPEKLLDSYNDERKVAADENIMNSSRSADFLTPRNPAHHLFRDAVLDLVEHNHFARPLVNSGRLSVPCHYPNSPLNGPDGLTAGPEISAPGAPCPDAPVGSDFLLRLLGANDFTVLTINCSDAVQIPGAAVVNLDSDGAGQSFLAKRFLGVAPSAVYLIRPDQHVAARWQKFDADAITQAIEHSLMKDQTP